MGGEGLITPAPLVSISGYNSVKSGGPTSISQHNPQQFHIWHQMETLVWLGRETLIVVDKLTIIVEKKSNEEGVWLFWWALYMQYGLWIGSRVVFIWSTIANQENDISRFKSTFEMQNEHPHMTLVPTKLHVTLLRWELDTQWRWLSIKVQVHRTRGPKHTPWWALLLDSKLVPNSKIRLGEVLPLVGHCS